MILETHRLILRPFTMDDLDALVPLFANSDFMRFSLGPYNRAQTATFLEKVIGLDQEGKPSQFALVRRSPSKLIGYCGFFHQIVDDVVEIEIGYRLDPEHWGEGLATDAARAARDHGFRDWQLPRLISLIHPENVASRRVAEKNGITLEKETIFRGFPTHVFAISQEDWT